MKFITRSWVLLLVFLSANLVVAAVETDDKDGCTFTYSEKVQGNYPLLTPVDVMDISNVSKWSTMIPSNLGSLAGKWIQNEKRADFSIKPAATGAENRLVIHLAADLRSPFGFYQPQPWNESIDPHLRAVLEKDPFNCYINRNLQTQVTTMKKYLEDCPPDLMPFECLKRVGLYDNFQCQMGTSKPICCYPSYFSETSDEIEYLKSDLEYMDIVHHNTVEKDLRKCRGFQNEAGLPEVQDKCPNNIKDQVEKELFYIFNKNSTCNPFVASTQNGCIVKKKLGPFHTPCFGTCITGLMVNVEIPAVKSYEDKADIVVTVLQRETDFSQKYGSALRKDFEQFGFVSSDTVESKEYFRVIRKKTGQSPLISGRWNSIWLKWSTRHPTCLNPTTESQTFAPVLEIGIKGIDYPFVNFEFACTNFEGDENDAMGWRFGWLGGDILIPRMPTVWSPKAFALNSVRGSSFEFSTTTQSAVCYKMFSSPIPFTLMIPIIFCASYFSIICICAVHARVDSDSRRFEREYKE